jgi:hypothetical protein
MPSPPLPLFAKARAFLKQKTKKQVLREGPRPATSRGNDYVCRFDHIATIASALHRRMSSPRAALHARRAARAAQRSLSGA